MLNGDWATFKPHTRFAQSRPLPWHLPHLFGSSFPALPLLTRSEPSRAHIVELLRCDSQPFPLRGGTPSPGFTYVFTGPSMVRVVSVPPDPHTWQVDENCGSAPFALA